MTSDDAQTPPPDSEPAAGGPQAGWFPYWLRLLVGWAGTALILAEAPARAKPLFVLSVALGAFAGFWTVWPTSPFDPGKRKLKALAAIGAILAIAVFIWASHRTYEENFRKAWSADPTLIFRQPAIPGTMKTESFPFAVPEAGSSIAPPTIKSPPDTTISNLNAEELNTEFETVLEETKQARKQAIDRRTSFTFYLRHRLSTVANVSAPVAWAILLSEISIAAAVAALVATYAGKGADR